MKISLSNNYILFTYFLTAVAIGNYALFSYDYHMDDAINIGSYHIHGSILSHDGIHSAIQNILNGYHLQWNHHERFAGILPAIRLVEIAISSEVKFHLILNLIFHSINAFFIYIFLVNYFKCNNINSLLLTTLFSLALNSSAGALSLSVWIGSFSVNLLTLYFILFFTYVKKSNSPKYFYIAYAIYFLLAIGNYSMAVVIPPLILSMYMHNEDVKSCGKIFILLLLPIIINLAARSFAPESTYIGTTPNLNINHIIDNILLILSKLVGGNYIVKSITTILIAAPIIIGVHNKKISWPQLLVALSLTLGYIFIYSLSSRDNFPDPYFLYIPYAGFILLIALATKSLNLNVYVTLIATVIIGINQYNDSQFIRELRVKTSSNILTAKLLFKDIEKKTISNKKQLVILLYDEHRYSGYPLGVFNKTINTWKHPENNSTYIYATDYIYTSNDGLHVITGAHQYTNVHESLMPLEVLASNHNIDPENYVIAQVRGNSFTITPINALANNNIRYSTKYRKEKYKNGKRFSWTDGNLRITAHFSSNDIGKYATVNINITSLFDDEIEIYSNSFKESFNVKANKTYSYFKRFKVNSSAETISLKSSKTTTPPGDSRKLSFRVDDDISTIIESNNLTL